MRSVLSEKVFLCFRNAAGDPAPALDFPALNSVAAAFTLLAEAALFHDVHEDSVVLSAEKDELSLPVLGGTGNGKPLEFGILHQRNRVDKIAGIDAVYPLFREALLRSHLFGVNKGVGHLSRLGIGLEALGGKFAEAASRRNNSDWRGKVRSFSAS